MQDATPAGLTFASTPIVISPTLSSLTPSPSPHDPVNSILVLILFIPIAFLFSTFVFVLTLRRRAWLKIILSSCSDKEEPKDPNDLVEALKEQLERQEMASHDSDRTAGVKLDPDDETS
jgi:hypothetical protein